ncbi:hypothetical protein BGX38DRAFT_289906 [Terfezia claveryi]|nr:hypothetical protein BGX38DRAFT_289906 [Terfezia claveryi]
MRLALQMRPRRPLRPGTPCLWKANGRAVGSDDKTRSTCSGTTLFGFSRICSRLRILTHIFYHGRQLYPLRKIGTTMYYERGRRGSRLIPKDGVYTALDKVSVIDCFLLQTGIQQRDKRQTGGKAMSQCGDMGTCSTSTQSKNRTNLQQGGQACEGCLSPYFTHGPYIHALFS